jgi:hypothetical protein
MKRFVLISIAFMAVALFATINVRLNPQGKNDKFSYLILSELNATATAGQGNVICHVSRTCMKTVYSGGQWVEREVGKVECWGYTPGETCTGTSDGTVTCDGTTHSCNSNSPD